MSLHINRPKIESKPRVFTILSVQPHAYFQVRTADAKPSAPCTDASNDSTYYLNLSHTNCAPSFSHFFSFHFEIMNVVLQAWPIKCIAHFKSSCSTSTNAPSHSFQHYFRYYFPFHGLLISLSIFCGVVGVDGSQRIRQEVRCAHTTDHAFNTFSHSLWLSAVHC